MANVFHKDFTLDNNHALTARTFADITARDNDTAFNGNAVNIDKIVRVDDALGQGTGYFILVSIGPPVWESIGTILFDSFLELIDTPSSYIGNVGKSVQVNIAETALEFGQRLRPEDTPEFLRLGVGEVPQALVALSVRSGSSGLTLDIRGEVAGVIPGKLRFFEADASAFENSIALVAPVALASDYTITLPAIPTNAINQILVNQIAGGVVTSAYTQNPTIGGNLTLTGNLTVNGLITTINSLSLLILDNNITIGNIGTPTDANADGGGITLKGTSDKTITWKNATDSWVFNEGIIIEAGNNLLVDTNTLFVNSLTNRVGIGTIVPLSRLHIETPAGANVELLVKAIGTDDADIIFEAAALGQWKVGLHESDSAKFKITHGGPAVFGADDYLIIDKTTGKVQLFNNNLELNNQAIPTDANADGGGITLRGTSDKTIKWFNDTDAWSFNQHVALEPFGAGAGETGELRFIELIASGGNNYVGFKAADAILANIVWTLPDVDGADQQVLATNGAGILSWETMGTGDIRAPVSGVTVLNEVVLYGNLLGTLAENSGIIFDQLKALFVPGGGGFNGPLSPSSMSLTTVTTNSYGTLSRHSNGNSYGFNKNMGFTEDTAGNVVGTFTADGRFDFGAKLVNGYNNLFFSTNGLDRIDNRCLEYIVDTSKLTTPNPALEPAIIVGFSGNTFSTGLARAAFSHGIELRGIATQTDITVKIFEGGVDKGAIAAFTIGQTIRVRIILATLGAFYSISINGGPFENKIFITGTTLTPVFAGVSIEEGQFMLSEMHIYDEILESELILDSNDGDPTLLFRSPIVEWFVGMDVSESNHFHITESAPGIADKFILNTDGILEIRNAFVLKPFNTDPGDTSELRFRELAATGTNYVGFKAPDLIGPVNVIWILPAADGLGAEVLSTDGAEGLSWVSRIAGPAVSKVNEIFIADDLVGDAVNQSGIIFDQLKALFVPGGGGFNGPLAPSPMSLTTVTTNSKGSLTRFTGGNVYGFNKNMSLIETLPGADVAGTFTADGRYEFVTKPLVVWNNLFHSTVGFDRQVGRTFECIVDTSQMPTTHVGLKAFMAGFTEDAIGTIDSSFADLIHAYQFLGTNTATTIEIKVFELGFNIGPPTALLFPTGVVLRARIILKASGADYFIAADGGPFQFVFSSSGITQEPLFCGHAILQGLFMLSDSQIYDQEGDGKFTWLTENTAVSADFPGTVFFGITDTTVSRVITILSADILVNGTIFIIKDESNAASNPNNIEIATQGAENIDGGASSVFITAASGVVRLYAHNNNLFSW